MSCEDDNIGKIVQTLEYGSINIVRVIIENVALVARLKLNRMGVSQICDKGYHLDFYDQYCEVVTK